LWIYELSYKINMHNYINVIIITYTNMVHTHGIKQCDKSIITALFTYSRLSYI
jgi:hypothetical protein